MKKIKHAIKFVINIMYIPEILCLYVIANIKYFYYKDIWLISERGDEAKDNGYKLFKYISENKLRKDVYYVIDKKNISDYNRVKHFENLVQYKSFKHKILFIQSSKLICTHPTTIIPWNYGTYKYFKKIYFWFMKNKKYIFLQHGIIKDDLSDVLGEKAAKFDLFICGAYPEYEYVKDTFGYSKNKVVYTGLARYDDLYEFKNKKYILVMPTWRTYLNKDENVFLQSDYYLNYKSILNNSKINNLLEYHGYKLIFYPHYEIQKYINKFDTENKNIIIADKNNYDVQQLLKESELLITDFSSVFFDFAYMKKPTIYYQFDEDVYFKNHYKKGYFNYRRNGFGPVVTSEDELIQQIDKYFATSFELEQKYCDRLDKFFKLRDKENCNRIYNEIIKI